MKVDSICALLIDFLRQNHFNESTIFNYQGVIRRFKQFYASYDTADYSPEIGNIFANDVISKVTGKFSIERYLLQGRFIRLLNSYFYTGNFNLGIKKRGKQQPGNPSHLRVYKEYEKFLNAKYDIKSTTYGYLNGGYYFLQYLNSINLSDLSTLSSKEVFSYIKSLKLNQQKYRLYRLRGFLQFLNRNDLLTSIEGVHGIRYGRIVTMLTESEKRNLSKILNNNQLTARDSAIIKLGFYTGIRACDVIKLKLSDIDWDMEIIRLKFEFLSSYNLL